MRRVYDDHMYEATKNAICAAFNRINPRSVSEYDYGAYRANVGRIKNAVLSILNRNGEKYMLGRVEHAHGIGNNNAIEVIYLGDNEQQICALMNINSDLYGGCFCYVTDIDGKRKSPTTKIIGTR